MNTTIGLTKVEIEILKELQKKDKWYKKGLEENVRCDLATDHRQRCGIIINYTPKGKMKLILHIGTEKTGTTSIQQFLKKNIDQLDRNGVYVPRTPMVKCGNHRWIPVFANNAKFSDEFVILQQFKNEEDREERVYKKRSQFIDECRNAANTSNTLILTSEHFQSRLRTAEEVHRLRDLVEKIADQTTIIIYIRDPLKTAVSLLSTAIKSGGAQRSLPTPSSAYVENVCNHSQTIKRWQGCFPDAKIMVRRFDRSFLAKGDVVIDFCSQVIDDFCEEEYDFLEPTNGTLTLTGMALLFKLNLQFPRFINNKTSPMRGSISEFVMKNTLDGSKFLPCRDEFEAYRKHFSESNESVRSHYFPLDESLFIDQKEFAENQIDLAEVEIDSQVYEKLVGSLWKQKRKLELRLRDAK